LVDREESKHNKGKNQEKKFKERTREQVEITKSDKEKKQNVHE
jgi:hypothetical protein